MLYNYTYVEHVNVRVQCRRVHVVNGHTVHPEGVIFVHSERTVGHDHHRGVVGGRDNKRDAQVPEKGLMGNCLRLKATVDIRVYVAFVMDLELSAVGDASNDRSCVSMVVCGDEKGVGATPVFVRVVHKAAECDTHVCQRPLHLNAAPSCQRRRRCAPETVRRQTTRHVCYRRERCGARAQVVGDVQPF